MSDAKVPQHPPDNACVSSDFPRRWRSRLGLAGCAHSRMTTGSISRDGGKPVEQMSAPELQAAAGSLGKTYAAEPERQADGAALRQPCCR